MRGHAVTNAGPNGVQPIGHDSMPMNFLQSQRTHLRHDHTCASEAHIINWPKLEQQQLRTKTILLTHMATTYTSHELFATTHAALSCK